MWAGNPFKFGAMPNGYVDAMRIFTKLLKPVFSTLREFGYESVIYVDDSLLQGETFEECMSNIIATLKALQELGFIIHPKKSVLVPTKKITFLGFKIDTENIDTENMLFCSTRDYLPFISSWILSVAPQPPPCFLLASVNIV